MKFFNLFFNFRASNFCEYSSASCCGRRWGGVNPSKKLILGFLIIFGLNFISLAIAQEKIDDKNNWTDIRSRGVLRCGAAIASPYVMRDPSTGKHSGFSVELCREFGEKILGVKVEIVDTTWDNIVAGIQSNSWDLALALNMSPERKRVIAFSEVTNAPLVSFVFDKNNPKLSNVDTNIINFDKKGIRFAVMSGTAQDRSLSRVIKKGTIQRLLGLDETRLALISKRVDVLVDEDITNDLFILANPDWAISVTPLPLLREGKDAQAAFGMNLSRSEADKKLFNDFIIEKRESGEIEKLIQKASKEAVDSLKR